MRTPAISFPCTALMPIPQSPGKPCGASSGERYITVFGELEVVNALHLRVFRKELSGSQVQSSLSDFEKDMRDGIFLLRPLPEQVFERAGQLSGQTTSRLGTRTVDLLHVAVALELAAECLYSFDQQQPAARQMRRVAFFCNCRKKYHLDAGYQGPLNVTGAMESLGSP